MGYPAIFYEAIQELFLKELIQVTPENNERVQLSKLGYEVVEKGLNYEEWVNTDL